MSTNYVHRQDFPADLFATRWRMTPGNVNDCFSQKVWGGSGMASWNDSVIETFRANDGVLGGPWENKTVILMHSVGKRTGKEYVHPLVAAPDGDALVVCGTMGGSPIEPLWVGNLEANAQLVTIEIGKNTVAADSTVVRPGDAQWRRLYQIWREYWPDAANYEKKTDRKFPVARLRIRDQH